MTAGSPKRFTLGAGQRLKQGRDFLRLKSQGARLTRGPLVANWAAAAPGAPSRLGVITSRRIGGAVVRNRARRLLREAFRRHQHRLAAPVDLVLVARPSIAGRSFAAVEKDFLAAARQAGLLTALPE